ncbi:hypothetical protein DLJ53_17525 [Acuticoccus sediminis]|uniref:Uncharacterized protein n=1 Tax=Acuticoccus sediminis TaxID=2184697 RepID=A0A8B2NV26_9HYPH|nr:hypothetical protein [Acuticoccus sediminis]RAI01023.1 hypothetical protein DLJ53_17525 [Acuticoccus sediminis]
MALKLDDLPDEFCERCGTPIETHLSYRRFCSGRCKRMVYYREAHPVEPRTCAGCGVTFLPRRSDAKYCSPKCGNAVRNPFNVAVYREERLKQIAGRTCAQCGTTFDARRRDQIYCSERCGKAASKARQRAKAAKEN